MGAHETTKQYSTISAAYPGLDCAHKDLWRSRSIVQVQEINGINLRHLGFIGIADNILDGLLPANPCESFQCFRSALWY